MKTFTRADFAFKYIQHIENNGGIDAVVAELPPEESGFTAGPLIRAVYETAVNYNNISYRQYFMSLGTLFEFEVLT